MAERRVGLLSQRWWPVRDNAITTVAMRFTIEARMGSCQIVPAGPSLDVGGETAVGPVPLLNMDTVKTADAHFRFRRLPAPGL